MEIVNNTGPVEATFKVQTKYGEKILHVMLDGLVIDTENVYTEMPLDDLLDHPMICFSDRIVVFLRETKVLPDETGRYGRFKNAST